MLDSFGTPESPSSSEKAAKLASVDLLKANARKIIESFGLTDEELAHFSYYFKLMDKLTPPAVPKALPPLALPAISEKKKTLVLDLDETLVHAEDEFDLNPTPENTAQYKVRPGLKKFLVEMSSLYEIVVFTASTRAHADPLIKAIDKKRRYIKSVLYRDSCVNANGSYVKDLRILQNCRDLKNVVIVDDSIVSISFNIDNGIVVKAYMGEDEDDELNYLGSYLKTLAITEDMRSANRQILQLNKLKKLLAIIS